MEYKLVLVQIVGFFLRDWFYFVSFNERLNQMYPLGFYNRLACSITVFTATQLIQPTKNNQREPAEGHIQ